MPEKYRYNITNEDGVSLDVVTSSSESAAKRQARKQWCGPIKASLTPHAEDAKSNAERQLKLRKSRLDAGLVRVELYATPANAEKIRKYAEMLK